VAAQRVNVGQLRAAVAELPDDMPVYGHWDSFEWLCHGWRIDDHPGDPGDTLPRVRSFVLNVESLGWVGHVYPEEGWKQ